MQAGIVVVLTFLLTTLDGSTADGTTNNQLTKAVNDFSFKLYNELIKTNENLFCSGYSFSVALNMLLVGARGNTADEIRKTLNYDTLGLTETQIVHSFHDLLSQQQQNHSGYEFDIVNSMWIHSNLSVRPEFENTVVNKFYAEAITVKNFDTPAPTDAINSWVEKETKGKIRKLFDKALKKETRVVLVNAMYFKGTWETKFNKELTEQFPFNYKDNATNQPQTKNIDMMNLVSQFPYTESHDLKSQLIEIPYHGNEVTMVIALPFPDHELNEVEQALSANTLNAALDTLSNNKVSLRIPKFESSSTLELEKVLIDLGIRDAFDPYFADLSGINNIQKLPGPEKSDALHVSKTIQKAVVEVSEEGTVAAAASGIVASIRTIPAHRPKEITFIADRPFLYFIRHKPTGLLYFMGRFSKP